MLPAVRVSFPCSDAMGSPYIDPTRIALVAIQLSYPDVSVCCSLLVRGFLSWFHWCFVFGYGVGIFGFVMGSCCTCGGRVGQMVQSHSDGNGALAFLEHVVHVLCRVYKRVIENNEDAIQLLKLSGWCLHTASFFGGNCDSYGFQVNCSPPFNEKARKSGWFSLARRR
jgi:hypothetical protein